MYRRPFTTQDAYVRGFTHSALKHGVEVGTIQRLHYGVYLDGPEPATRIERALALLVATNGVASGGLAGVLHELDSAVVVGAVVTARSGRYSGRQGVSHAQIDEEEVVLVDGYPCTNSLRTLVDLATTLDDVAWEQALESALRKEHVAVTQLASISQVRGAERIRRVLALRPHDAPPTESLLETLMVQLIRTDPRLPTPKRQVVVRNESGRFVARVDLAWPDRGIFLELDGQHHAGQPVYDANRQTAVVAAKAWLPGRFTWHEVTRAPKATLWRLGELFEQASQLRRPA